MEETISTPYKVKIIDVKRLKAVTDQALAEQGIILRGEATYEQLMELMLAEGVDPKQNIGSRDIIRARYCGED